MVAAWSEVVDGKVSPEAIRRPVISKGTLIACPVNHAHKAPSPR
jgi:hypothetical protein